MCSLTAAMIGLTVGQTGLQMAAQHQQTKAAVAQAEAQAAAAEQNAKIQNRQSELIAEQYLEKQNALRDKRKIIQGAQRAEAGAAGIAGGTGSSMDMQIATTNAYLKDSVNLLSAQREDEYNSALKETDFKNQAHTYRAQAEAAKQAGRMAQWGTILSGVTQLAGLKLAQGTSAATKSTSANEYALYAGPSAGGAGYLKGTVATTAFSKDLANLGTTLLPTNVTKGYQTYKNVWQAGNFNLFGGK